MYYPLMYRSEWAHVLIGRLWSSDGCTTLEKREDNSVTCQCTHLTSFAVLIQFTEHHTDDETAEGKALTLISQIGCAVSLFCLITTFSVFIYLEYVCPTFYYFILLELDQSEIRAFTKLDSCNIKGSTFIMFCEGCCLILMVKTSCKLFVTVFFFFTSMDDVVVWCK